MPLPDLAPNSSRTTVRFRRASAADAEALSLFARRIFIETFGPDNDPGDMEMYTARAFTPSAQRGELDDAARVCLIGEDEAGIAAYALLRAGDADPAVVGAKPVEIERFYVDARWHGGGVAATMMALVVDSVHALGGETLWLGVWERNARAIRFYERQGFRDVGSHEFLVGTDRQTDRIMAWVLTRSLGPAGSSDTTQAREHDAWPA